MYALYNWSTGDTITAARLDNLETQYEEGTDETHSAPTISAGTLTLDLDVSRVFLVSLSANITTLTISNAPGSTRLGYCTVRFRGDGTARAISWPAAVKWPGNVAPTPTSTSGKDDWYTFWTPDAGTTWYGAVLGQDY